MKRIALALLITAFAVGPALAQEVAKRKQLVRTASRWLAPRRRAFSTKCKREACAPKAVGSDGKALKGAAKNSFMAKCEKET